MVMPSGPNEPNKVKWGDLLPWLGLAVTVAPAVGYAMAFLRELGFCHAFKIPINFIRLDMANTLVAVGEGLGLVVIVLLCIALMHEKGLGPIQRGLMPWFTMFAAGTYICFISGVSMYIGLAAVAGIATIVFVYFVLVDLVTHGVVAIFKFIKKKRWWHKPCVLDAIFKFMKDKGWWPKPDKPTPKSAFSDFMLRHSRWLLIIVMLASTTLWGMYAAGSMQARLQKDSFVPSTRQDSVVLRVYGDNLVCAPFHDKTVEESFFVIKMDDQPRPVLELRTGLGPLTPSKIMPGGNSTAQDSGNVTGR